MSPARGVRAPKARSSAPVRSANGTRVPAPDRSSKSSASKLRASKNFTSTDAPLVGGPILSAKTSSGTPVLVRPMKGFSKSYALLATRFGSLDARLPDGTVLPVGLAHFLEHKMFATPDGDVFDLYAKRGASANAYTTFNHTAYLFSCTSRFDENLATLLATLSAMHADAKAIAREKGIIGQEIAMYDDDASWRGYFGLLGALYRDHPIRLDPAGTKETIAPIDRDVLVKTHAAYYHPANLILCVAGDVDPVAVLEQAEAALCATTPGSVNHRPPTAEPSAPASSERTETLSVSRPQVTLGWKDVPVGSGGRALLDREAETEVVLDALFGDGGLVEAPLYREGVVDESLSASYQAEADYGFATVSAEVDDAPAFRTRLLDAISAAKQSGVTAAYVERAKRRALGGYVRTFNSPERAASLLLSTALKDTTLSEAIDAIVRVTPARAAARFEHLLACEHAWSTIIPRKNIPGKNGLPEMPPVPKKTG